LGLTHATAAGILGHMNAQTINNWWWLPAQEGVAG